MYFNDVLPRSVYVVAAAAESGSAGETADICHYGKLRLRAGRLCYCYCVVVLLLCCSLVFFIEYVWLLWNCGQGNS